MAVLRCTAAYAVMVNGVPRVVAHDELVDSNDPIVKGREQHFETVDQHMQRRRRDRTDTAPVEQATAAPGEKRSVGRPRKAAAKDDDS